MKWSVLQVKIDGTKLYFKLQNQKKNKVGDLKA